MHLPVVFTKYPCYFVKYPSKNYCPIKFCHKRHSIKLTGLATRRLKVHNACLVHFIRRSVLFNMRTCTCVRVCHFSFSLYHFMFLSTSCSFTKINGNYLLKVYVATCVYKLSCVHAHAHNMLAHDERASGGRGKLAGHMPRARNNNNPFASPLYITHVPVLVFLFGHACTLLVNIGPDQISPCSYFGSSVGKMVGGLLFLFLLQQTSSLEGKLMKVGILCYQICENLTF